MNSPPLSFCAFPQKEHNELILFFLAAISRQTAVPAVPSRHRRPRALHRPAPRSHARSLRPRLLL